MITMKFGGTSVGSAEAIDQTASIIAEHLAEDKQIAVIVSAMSGVTDLLIQSVEKAINSDKWGYLSISNEIRDKHEDVINQLLRAGDTAREYSRANQQFD